MPSYTKDEEDLIRALYPFADTDDLAYILRRNISAVRFHARQMGLTKKIHHSTYLHDRRFFEIPDSINAFWAGWVGADGCIYKSRKNSIAMSSAIQERDRCLLEALKSDIKYTGPIRENEVNGKKYCILSINAFQQCANDLEVNFNITSRKSLTLKPPNLEDPDLKWAYICGYFVGDGTHYIKINRNKYRSHACGFVGTLSVLKWIRSTINEDLDNVCLKSNISKNGNIYMLQTTGTKAECIMDKMYLYDRSGLDRKFYNKSTEMLIAQFLKQKCNIDLFRTWSDTNPRSQLSYEC